MQIGIDSSFSCSQQETFSERKRLESQVGLWVSGSPLSSSLNNKWVRWSPAVTSTHTHWKEPPKPGLIHLLFGKRKTKRSDVDMSRYSKQIVATWWHVAKLNLMHCELYIVSCVSQSVRLTATATTAAATVHPVNFFSNLGWLLRHGRRLDSH